MIAPMSDTSPQSPHDTAETPTTSLSILALDDDDDFRQYLRTQLEQEGHSVRTSATPDEFFATAEQQLPDVVLLDMKMGRWSGEDVLAEIRRRWKTMCVIVVTGYPSMDSMRQTFKQDVFDYIAKPFSLAEMRRSLAQAVETLGLGRRPLDQLRQSLGRQIRIARTEKGWTLKDLSEACGISVSQLSSIERGTHLPSLESLVGAAQALGHQPSAWLEAAGF
jgi:CheY-like chemotaxis protein/DNA-binding XRE family transcriptional regulator